MRIRRRGAGAWCGLIVGALLAGGCSAVTTSRPLPQKIDAAERARLGGTWLSGGDVVFVRFDSRGVGQLGGLDWKDDAFHLDRAEIVVHQGTKRSFMSARSEENGEWEPEYYLLRYRFTDDGDLVLWTAAAPAFAAAVESGALAGTVDRSKYGTSVTISSTPEALAEFLDEPANESLFDYTDPMVVRRIVAVPSAENATASASSEPEGPPSEVLQSDLEQAEYVLEVAVDSVEEAARFPDDSGKPGYVQLDASGRVTRVIKAPGTVAERVTYRFTAEDDGAIRTVLLAPGTRWVVFLKRDADGRLWPIAEAAQYPSSPALLAELGAAAPE